MTTKVRTAEEDTLLCDIAALFEKHHIKSIPILKHGKLVGMVNRSHLLDLLAEEVQKNAFVNRPAADILIDLLVDIKSQPWLKGFSDHNITIQEGTVLIKGMATSEEQLKGLIVLTENIPGVVRVVDETIKAY